MTGYGVANGEWRGQTVTVEIRALNSRFREFISRLPHPLVALEDSLKKLLSTEIFRGRIEIRAQLEPAQTALTGFKFDKTRAEAALALLTTLVEETGVSGPITLDHLLAVGALSEAGSPSQTLDLTEDFGPFFLSLGQAALDQVISFREREGAGLRRELETILAWMEQELKQIREIAGEANKIIFQKTQARLQELTEKLLDPDRLTQEAAILADRLDITEEIARFGEHLVAFGQLLGEPGPIGRRLEFLLQELGREANTMGSKSQWRPLTEEVLALKADLEKAREQVQNIE
jgi:uncharacterized protein (TIGR00255 family)